MSEKLLEETIREITAATIAGFRKCNSLALRYVGRYGEKFDELTAEQYLSLESEIRNSLDAKNSAEYILRVYPEEELRKAFIWTAFADFDTERFEGEDDDHMVPVGEFVSDVEEIVEILSDRNKFILCCADLVAEEIQARMGVDCQ